MKRLLLIIALILAVAMYAGFRTGGYRTNTATTVPWTFEQILFQEDAERTGEGTCLFANGMPIGMTTPGDCQGMKMEFDYGVTPTRTGGGKVIQGLMLKMTMDQNWHFASANRNADVRGAGIQAELNDSLGGMLEAIYANAYTDIAANKQIVGEHTTAAYGVGMCAVQARTEIKGAGALTVPHIAGVYILHRRMGAGGVTGDYHAIHIENSQNTGAISGTETGIHFEPNTMAPPGANFDYGVDMNAVDFGTADFRLSSGGLIANAHADTITVTETNINMKGKVLFNDVSAWMLDDSLFFTDGGADTSFIVQNGTNFLFNGDNNIQFGSFLTSTSSFQTTSDGSYLQLYGYRMMLDDDADDSLSMILFGATDTLKWDSIPEAFTLTAPLTVNGGVNYAADAQSDDAYEVAIPGITALTAGLTVTFLANTLNTDAATLEITSVGDIDAILKLSDQALVTGDIEAGQIVVVVWDGSNWQMTSQLAQ